MISTQRIRPRLLLLFLLLCFASRVFAQRVPARANRSLSELVARAERIVRGHILQSRVEPHPQFPNLMTVVVTLGVEETLKGDARLTLKFRQYVWNIRDQLSHAPYGKGEELLLMLNPVSRYGLTSPVGLEQGRFRIQRDSQGQTVAVNGKANTGLFGSAGQSVRANGSVLSTQGMTTGLRPTSPGPVPLVELQDAIRNLVRAGK